MGLALAIDTMRRSVSALGAPAAHAPGGYPGLNPKSGKALGDGALAWIVQGRNPYAAHVH
jgi:hypothetical protein